MPKMPKAAEARLLVTRRDRPRQLKPRTRKKGAGFVPYR
jgi:hypothetical protein